MSPNTSLNVSTTARQSPCVDIGYLPSSRQFFQDLSTAERVIIITCCVLTPITVAMYSEHVHFLLRLKTHWMDPRSSVWVLSVVPVTSLNAALNLCMPRLAAVSDLISSMTLSLAILHFKLEVLDHFGDVNTVLQALKSVRIPISAPPLCFFHSCCPSFQLTRFRYRLITCCVLQAAIIQSMAAILSLVLITEDNFRQMTLQSPDFYLSVVKCVSSLLGVYGLYLAVAATESVWKPLDLTLKCAILVSWLCLFNGQGLIFALLNLYAIPACTGHLSSRVKGRATMNLLLLMEMLVMTVLARYFYHRKFDLSVTEPGLFEESKEMSGFENRSCTGSADSATDPWADPGLTDSSLFLTDSSEMSKPEEECQTSRTVVVNYGTISPTDAQRCSAGTTCEDCNISLAQITDQQE
ncbi:unnamed protein product [Candidula unifasciata]|uniref:Uncharacterized protein n=1 Tax=Candidula unifasciata TaxID=100452 RepID=A0A8S3Z0S6_9EUPU|nr:unnamed protein product [Candidula unifasciata]